MKHLIAIVALAEGLTGVGAVLFPAPAIDLFFGIAAPEPMIVFCQALGAALVGLAFACWPRGGEREFLRTQCHSLACYSGLVTLILVSAALNEPRPILWGAAVLHGVLTLLLILQRTPLSRPAVFTL